MKTKHNRIESAVRRMAKRQGLALEKSRARDPENYLFGTYQLIDADRNFVVLSDRDYGRGFGCSLEECDQFLREQEIKNLLPETEELLKKIPSLEAIGFRGQEKMKMKNRLRKLGKALKELGLSA